MKYTMILWWCLISVACFKNEGDQAGGYITSEAYLVNQLAVDGCGWHFTISQAEVSLRYAADQTSKDNVVAPFIETQTHANGLYSIKVEISFKLTQKQHDVLCGWNTTSSMDEIQVLNIKKI